MPLQAIASELAKIGDKAGFVSVRSAAANDLALDIAGIGRIRLPVSPTTARKLIELARPARHGYKNETRLDRRVRDTFEISANRITFAGSAWQRRLSTQLEHIRRDLGLTGGRRLRAELHNLLIYAPGQFFVSHRDSEKDDAMVASLVVGLPSRFSGGAMVIEHRGERTTVRGSASKLTFSAFYADCPHEVLPVKEGYRLALTFNLLLDGEPDATPASSPGRTRLTTLVNRYFATTPPPRREGDAGRGAPDRLIYLLDHQYTQRGLDLKRLKGADALRAAELQAIAAATESDLCLALVDVHETWNCDAGFDGSWRGRSYYDDPDEEDVDDPDEDGPDTHELTDLIDSQATLQHLKAVSGKAPTMTAEIDGRELCYTKPSVEFDPFESEYEGFMGNYGNTMERWYHRAAIVLWPRNRGFVMRAKVEPRWALGEVMKTLKAQGSVAAIEQACTLAPFWAQSVRLTNDNSLFERALDVAAELDAPALAVTLLMPFSLIQLKAELASRVLRCVERHGLAWSQAILAHWQPPAISTERERLAWESKELPGLCRALRAGDDGDADGSKLARSVLQQEWKWLATQWRTRHRLQAPPEREVALTELSKPLLGVIEAALTVQHDDVRTTVFAALTESQDDMPTTPALALGILRAAHAHSSRKTCLALTPLHAYWHRRLGALLAQAPRRSDDWSIAQPLHCNCKFCSTMSRFLKDPKSIRHEWPLAEEHRRHIHRTIESHALPLTHTTRRSGRPYVLVLEKTRDLFTREAKQRSIWQHDLDWLSRLT
ncbi:MAG: hypothetical protein AMXMBFR59_19650 [Rhodanobacteraceae bacterium]